MENFQSRGCEGHSRQESCYTDEDMEGFSILCEFDLSRRPQVLVNKLTILMIVNFILIARNHGFNMQVLFFEMHM